MNDNGTPGPLSTYRDALRRVRWPARTARGTTIPAFFVLGKELEHVAVIPAGLEACGCDPAPGRGHVPQERQQQPNVWRVSGAHSLRDESSSRRPLDALGGQCRHVLRPISSRTPTSRCRFATADHPGPARGSRQGAGRAASGTRAARSSHPRLQERLPAPP